MRAASRTGSSSSSRAAPQTEPPGVQPSMVERWLAAVISTPGLTAIADPAAARAMLVDDVLRAADLVAATDGPIVDVGSGGGTPGIPLAAALPARAASRCSRPSAGSAASSRPGRPSCRTSTVTWGRAEEQEPEQFGVALAKALAHPPTAAEWCLPLVARGRPRRPLGRRVGRAGAGRARRGAARRRARGGPGGPARDPQDRPDAAGFPAPHRRREEASAGLRLAPHDPARADRVARASADRCRAG